MFRISNVQRQKYNFNQYTLLKFHIFLIFAPAAAYLQQIVLLLNKITPDFIDFNNFKGFTDL